MTMQREGEFYARPEETHGRVKKEPLLSSDFASEVNNLAGAYPDETRVGDLRIPSPSMKKENDFVAFGFLPDCNPPEDWAEFYPKLGDSVKKTLSIAFHQAMRAGFTTIGSIRDASEGQLRDPKAPGKKTPRISEQAATFLKEAFERRAK